MCDTKVYGASSCSPSSHASWKRGVRDRGCPLLETEYAALRGLSMSASRYGLHGSYYLALEIVLPRGLLGAAIKVGMGGDVFGLRFT